ncbi:MAG TPA: peptide MFS transporter [Vicinamibacterales bacterium]|jgi:POT family proton-dependent oligopeptide transporter|nr:peptide MFS transporter [Vicinamibacterales bacterium]
MTSVQPAPSVHADRSFFGHPRGLSTLFFTEMWERFSFYGMRALLILFMTAPTATGGLGFDAAKAGAIYGLYTSMVYLFTLPGGWIADRIIGAQRAVLVGGILIASGHFSMAVPSLPAFYLGLALIVFGTGLLKGNVSVIVGRLYGENDGRRDAGFSIFYMGINTGAFVSPFICGYLGQRVGWHLGFASAGVGMVFGLIQYMAGRSRLGDAGLHPAGAGAPDFQKHRGQAITWVSGGAAVLAVVALGMVTGVVPLTAVQIADAAGYMLTAVSVGFFVWVFLSGGWTRTERNHLIVIGVLFLGYALFSAVFEQAGSTLNLFADRNTRNEVFGWSFPSSWFQAANPLFVIAFAPVFAWLWVRLAQRGREPGAPAKFSFGLLLVGLGFAVLIPASAAAQNGVLVGPGWLTLTYLLHTWGELALSPVGLSAMSKLAPVRIGGLVMGVWFLGVSVGNYIGGRIAGLYESMSLPSLFGAVAAFAIVFGVLMWLFSGTLNRLSASESR